MTTDEKRIADKAHALWEAEGRPHGRDQAHWEQAREMIAIEDSMSATLLPRDAGAETPVEEKSIAIDNEGEAPTLTDTGRDDLTSTDREPAITAPPKRKAAAKKAATKDSAKTSAALAPAAKAKAPAKARAK